MRRKMSRNDPRRDPEFALLWVAMVELDYLTAFDLEDDEEASRPLREILDAHSRLVAKRRAAERNAILAAMARDDAPWSVRDSWMWKAVPEVPAWIGMVLLLVMLLMFLLFGTLALQG